MDEEEDKEEEEKGGFTFPFSPTISFTPALRWKVTPFSSSICRMKQSSYHHLPNMATSQQYLLQSLPNPLSQHSLKRHRSYVNAVHTGSLV